MSRQMRGGSTAGNKLNNYILAPGESEARNLTDEQFRWIVEVWGFLEAYGTFSSHHGQKYCLRSFYLSSLDFLVHFPLNILGCLLILRICMKTHLSIWKCFLTIFISHIPLRVGNLRFLYMFSISLFIISPHVFLSFVFSA